MEEKSKLKFWLALVLALGAVRAAAIEPSWRYRVLKSEHFDVIYREEQKPLAKQYLVAAERAYQTLLPFFKEAPASIPILLQDDTDAANGGAEFLPYPHITVYPVLPSTLDTIDDYGDWAYELMLHEYTHILNMYPAHGVYWPFKFIFGDLVRPNAVLPTWYLEGLAVDLESFYSDHGRLRASETLASARALVQDDKLKLESIARINEQTLATWPYGNRPYLYGGWWWQNVHSKYGVESLYEFNQDFSRRLPFLLNRPLRDKTTKSAIELYDEGMERQRARAEKDLTTIKAARARDNSPEAHAILSERGEQLVFALSPSGQRLVYWVGSALNDPGTRVMLKERTSPGQAWADVKPRELFRAGGTNQVRWLDEERFVYDALDLRRPFVTYRELNLYDFATAKSERLTKGLRAEQPAVAPGGAQLAFVQNDGGRTHLGVFDFATAQTRTLIRGSLTQRISTPEYLDATHILFVVRQKDGSEQINVLDTGTRHVRVWENRLKATQQLRRINKGYLVTDAGQNIRNVFWLHDGKIEAVSNTTTDIEAADYDPQTRDLVYSELTGDGHRLKSETLRARQPATLAKVDVPPPPKIEAGPVAFREENYQPLSYLRPRYWIPFIYQTDGGLVFQGITENHDPVGRNQYSLVASYDTLTDRVSSGANPQNDSLPTRIGLGYNRSEVYLGPNDPIRDTQGATLDFASFWPFNDNLTSSTLGGIWFETAAAGLTFRRLGPTFSFVHSGLSDPLHHWYTSNVVLTHAEFLPERGYLAYGRSTAQLTQSMQLAHGHRVSLVTRAVLMPKLPFNDVLLLGDPSLGGNYAVNLTNSNLLVRGYPTGEFIGRKVLNANVEYALPVKSIERGWGTFPWFLQNLETVLFADAISVDGAALDTNLNGYVRRRLSQFNIGTGAEFRVSTNAAYHLPLTLTLGLYYGTSARFGGGFSPFFGVGMGQLAGLQNKTP